MKFSQESIGNEPATQEKTLWFVYAFLMALLGATVLVAYFPMGVLNLLLAVTIALIKAGLVIWFFMHFRQARRLVAILFAASIFILMIGAILSFADYLTR